MSWWATALIALGASLTGALAGALVGARAAARQRCRAARAAILTDYLPPLHDRVNDAEREVDVGREPRPHGREISEAFQALDRFAAAASREDRECVHDPVWAWLLEIDEINEEFVETAGKPNPERAPVARATAARQLEVWQALNGHLAGYRDWLIADLGRRW